MGKTLDVAADRASDQTRTVIPVELERGFYITNDPSLAALKLFHLMMATAAGRMADDTHHQMRLAELRAIDGMKNHDRTSLAPLFEELRGVVVRQGNPLDDNQVVEIGGLLDQARLAAIDPTTGHTMLSWRFGGMFRDMAAKSDHWAIIDRQTIFHMTSKYSVLLFQHIASFENYDHIDSRTFTVQQLRTLLGIPKGKTKRFADLRRNILTPAIAEINQLSRMELTATMAKIGRTVATVTITWRIKDDPEPAKQELATSKVGRAARRTGTAETPPPTAFPASGSIAYLDYWLNLKRKAGCNMDNTMIADAFRAWCSSKGIRLDARTIADTFTNYCIKIGNIK